MTRRVHKPCAYGPCRCATTACRDRSGCGRIRYSRPDTGLTLLPDQVLKVARFCGPPGMTPVTRT
jgi:hypothetical protein